MKRIAALLLLFTLCIAGSLPAGAQNNARTKNNARMARKAAKQNRKAMKREGKRQRRAMKKNEKAQRRAAKHPYHR
jgi:hypothetical protein